MKASLKQSFITNENLDDNLFYSSLAEELNKIIEEELNKNYEDINAELIDDCCLALNAIYEMQNGECENSGNIANINSIIKKYNLQKRRKNVVSAACAAVAVFAVGTTIFTLGNETIVVEGGIIKSAVERLEQILIGKKPETEQTTEITQTTEEASVSETEQISQEFTEPSLTTEIIREIENITVIVPPGFNSTVTSRDDISLNNFSVSVNYTTGENDIIPISAVTYEICETKEDGFTEIKIYYKGFTASFYVTVLPEEKLNPVIVTSLYGTFANNYTIDDMRVFAVLSDGTEKEIPKSECVISTEDFFDGAETGIIVTVEYENCSFQFLSE